MIVVTAAEMREIDRLTIEHYGVPGVVLMDAAGRGVADVVASIAPPQGLRVAIVCGPGNNGGDGYVVARHLHNRGATVRVYRAAPRDRIAGDADVHLRIIERMGIDIVDATSGVAALDGFATEADVVVDALLGTGLSSEVRGVYRGLIEAMNGLRGVKVAIDVPSGLDADRGLPLGAAVRADHTVTMAFPKVGLVGDPGFTRVGRLHVVDIGVPRGLAEAQGARLSTLDEETVAPLVPPRPRGGHKGTFGHLVVIAGSAGKTGAALLCGLAALRAGTGLATVASTPAGQQALDAKTREVMTACYSLGEAPSDADYPRLQELLRGKDAVALGPGIPLAGDMASLVARLARECELPMVIDADGLNLLGADVAALSTAPAPRILTPHPGEMARLAGLSTAEVQADRLGVARRLASVSRAVVCLKGARTVVAAPDGSAWINTTGNPGLGTGGTGDVLCGMIGALLAQGLPAVDAARLAVFAHGRAGDLAAERKGEMALIAGDLLETLPDVLRRWERRA